MNYSTILVAPDLGQLGAGLAMAREEAQDILTSGLDVTPMIGRVTSTDLVRALRDSRHFVLWLITHGQDKGILLSDGLYPYTRLAALVRNKIGLVVLNTCDGIETAQAIQNATNAAIICSIKTIEDAEAYQFGALLARNLSIFQTIAAAYHASIPANNDCYVYLSGDMEAESVNGMDWQALYTELAKVAEAVHGLRTDIAIMKAQQISVNEKLNRYEQVLNELERIVTSLQHEDFRFDLELRNLSALSKSSINSSMTRSQYMMLVGTIVVLAVLVFLLILALSNSQVFSILKGL